MKIDFTKQKLHLVITSLDMPLGFNSLAEIALVYQRINVKKGRDFASFVSKNHKITKIIGYGNKDSILIVRHLVQGGFEQLMGSATGPTVKKLTARELYFYLDSEAIEIKPHICLKPKKSS